MARASGVLLDYAQQSVAVRHEVDGVWHSREPILRELADPMLVSFKTLAGLDPKIENQNSIRDLRSKSITSPGIAK